MRANLAAEMAREQVGNDEIAGLIKKTSKAVYNKINGYSDFTISEAILIRDAKFPSCSLEYLFADQRAEEEAGR